MAANVNKKNKGMGIHARRALAYIVLVIISFFCLFWFYVMIINATRSNGELQAGFTNLNIRFIVSFASFSVSPNASTNSLLNILR